MKSLIKLLIFSLFTLIFYLSTLKQATAACAGSNVEFCGECTPPSCNIAGDPPECVCCAPDSPLCVDTKPCSELSDANCLTCSGCIIVTTTTTIPVNYIQVNGTSFSFWDAINVTGWSDSLTAIVQLFRNMTRIQNGTGVQTNISSRGQVFGAGTWNVSANSTYNSTLEWKTFTVSAPTYTQAVPVAYQDIYGSGYLIRVNSSDNTYANLTEDTDTWMYVNFSDDVACENLYDAIIQVEHKETGGTDFTLEIEMNAWNGTGWLKLGEPTASATDINYTFNLYNAGIDTPDELNGIGIRWNITRSGGGGDQTWVDLFALNYSYSCQYPQYSLNSTNSTEVGDPVLFSLKWTDNVGLSSYIFSFDNGTGVLTNDTPATFSGIANWSNVTKVVNITTNVQIRWQVYANDTSNNWNASEIYSFNTTCSCGDICIFTSPYNISQNNTRYCLKQTLSTLSYGINFTGSAIANSDLDCDWNSIVGNLTWLTYGIYIPDETQNITITNCILYNHSHAIYFKNADNNTVRNTTLFNNTNGIEGSVGGASNNVFYNITAYNNRHNIVFFGQNWTIENSSIYDGTLTDYVVWFGSHEAINTNFTTRKLRFVAFNDGIFGYRNETGGILLKTSRKPITGTDTINRTLTNWNQTLMQWNDTGTVIAYYNISGLYASTEYEVYNNSVLVQTLSTDSSGILPQFSINLASEHEIKALSNNQTPQYSSNSTNNTDYGKPTLFSLYWTDNVNLSSYIFSLDNCTGSFVNDSAVSFSGTENWSNVSKIINSTWNCLIRWQVYANDTLDQWNVSEIFSFSTSTTDPYSPTWSNMTQQDWIYHSDNNRLSVHLMDDVALDAAIVYTSDSGNHTTGLAGTETWFNHSFKNSSHIGWVIWRVYFNDTSNNWNVTDDEEFEVKIGWSGVGPKLPFVVLPNISKAIELIAEKKEEKEFFYTPIITFGIMGLAWRERKKRKEILNEIEENMENNKVDLKEDYEKQKLYYQLATGIMIVMSIFLGLMLNTWIQII